MDKENFLNSSMLPPLQFDHPFASTWQSNNISHDHFLSSPPTSENFDSTLCSMVSSPVASGSAISNDNLLIRELIGKLGNICNSDNVTPPSLPPHISGIGGGNCSASNSDYSTPLTSPHKMSMPIMDQLIKQNFPTSGNSNAFRSNLPAICGDPGFAERAARFSSLGSKSFNGRMTPFGANNGNEEFGYRSNNNFGVTTQLQRVCSSPSINYGKQIDNLISNQGELSNSRENSSISGRNPSGEIGTNKKRKAVHKGKAKENQTPLPTISNKEVENDEESNAKRSKLEDAKTEENGGDENRGKQSNSNQKPPEPPKDYIHVRARRGQATDSHSLAERVRREKISERMKLLQDLVPGCNKVTGKALMLDEIINYVQSLQRQVEFLSMKLASVNPGLEFNMDNHFSKDVIQPNSSLRHPMYPIDSLATTLYGHPNQNGSQNSLTTTIGATMVPCPMDPLNPTLIYQNNSMQLPLVDGFPNVVPQLSSLCEGDLHSIVQMSYGRKDNGFQSQPLHGTNRKPLMKAEF